MPSLQVRDLPERIYQKLVEEAEKQNRSITQQAIWSLAKALNAELDAKSRRQRVLEMIKTCANSSSMLSDPVKMIREDRSR